MLYKIISQIQGKIKIFLVKSKLKVYYQDICTKRTSTGIVQEVVKLLLRAQDRKVT